MDLKHLSLCILVVSHYIRTDEAIIILQRRTESQDVVFHHEFRHFKSKKKSKIMPILFFETVTMVTALNDA